MLEDVREYDEAIVTYVDDEGYPFSYPSSYRIEDGAVVLERHGWLKKKSSDKVSVLFNHITPLPTGGYMDRRYIVLWGGIEEKQDTIRFTPSRRYSWDEKKVHFFQYCEISVPRGRRYMQLLERELGRKLKPALSLFSLFFRVTRLPFLIATVVPTLLGAAVAAYHGIFDPLLFILTLIGVAAIHLGLNMANDYYDTKLGADNVNTTPTPFSGGSRALQYGLITPSAAVAMFSSFYALGLGIGLYLAITRGLVPILSLMLLGFILSFFYTAPPLKLAYRGVGEIAVGVGFGPVIVLGSYYVQTQGFHIAPLLASLPVGILIALILYANEIPDKRADALAGKRTLVVRLDDQTVMKLYKALIALVYAIIVLTFAAGYAPFTTLLALLTIPTARKAVKQISETYGNPYYMIPGLATNIKLATTTGLLLAVGYIIPAAYNLLIT